MEHLSHNKGMLQLCSSGLEELSLTVGGLGLVLAIIGDRKIG